MLRKISGGLGRRRRWAAPAALPRGGRGHVVLTEARLEQLTEAEITTLALRNTQPMTVQNVLSFAERVDDLASVLQEELPVRYAHRIKMLELLPGWEQKLSITHVRGMYLQSFKEIREHASGHSERFQSLLWDMLKRHSHTNMVMGGIRKYVQDGELQQEEVNEWLDRFFAHRVSANMMISHYLQLAGGKDFDDVADPYDDSYQNFISPRCHPYRIAKNAADIVGKLCNAWYGCAPKIQVIDAGAQPFPFVPKYLFYILSELLKNAVRATVEFHRNDAGKAQAIMPPVQVLVCSDRNVSSIRISDEGGGIPVGQLNNVWSYLYTTADPIEIPLTRESVDAPTDLRRLDLGVIASTSLADGDEEQNILMRSPLAGLGCGLPLARLYAQYLGGDVKLHTLPKFGTDVFVYLYDLADHIDSLPAY
mmetsp:Transcript_77719/g.219788  ORF Transcript_77719/g.219788 Transcript_77719/m.219788 type:complete len:422 (-) Transcript_77719:319-1584(-)